LRFASGLLAQFDCALSLERREFYEIAGTDGRLMIPVAFLPGTAETTIRQGQGRKGETVHTIAGVDEYQLMVEHFVDCVRSGQPFRYDAAEAAANMRTIEALYRSARNGGRPEAL